MDHFKIDLVCHGTSAYQLDVDGKDPYEVPKKLGKFLIVESGSALSTSKIVDRIVRNRYDYMTRNQEKEQKEIEFLKNIDDNDQSERLSSDANNNHANEAAERL